MTPIAIRAEGLSKKYRVGGDAPRSLRETLSSAFRRGPVLSSPEEFWALDDVSFEVSPGEVLGVIGPNGSGKSTLLKILSRITEPTRGRAEIRGRVASLLEVGTGFHGELTGRENTFLNGAILGMRRTEIARKFDEIVAFAEVERFIDTPVKHYSSGMYVRLAFAVAAHLEPEILVIDEVLAVGDVAFQRKCLGKMSEVAASDGRAILFVSHNMPAVERLCHSCVLLSRGKVSQYGPASVVVRQNLRSDGAASLEWRLRETPPAHPYIDRVALVDEDGRPATVVTSASDVGLDVTCVIPESVTGLRFSVTVQDSMGQALFTTIPLDDGLDYPLAIGTHRYRVAFPPAVFMPQRYAVAVSLYLLERSIHHLQQAVVFDVAEVASMVNTGDPTRMGFLQLGCRWEHAFTPRLRETPPLPGPLAVVSV